MRANELLAEPLSILIYAFNIYFIDTHSTHFLHINHSIDYAKSLQTSCIQPQHSSMHPTTMMQNRHFHAEFDHCNQT